MAEFLSAVQFLTRLPVPAQPYESESLARSVKFFPAVGAIVGGGGALLHRLVVPHLPRTAAALVVVLYLVCVTGGLHEDGLADAADGFGSGTSREKILVILRDSRIGSFGGMALVLSLVGRLLLIASLPLQRVSCYLITASVLCRWTPLPLSYFLPPARTDVATSVDGQGARIARLTSTASLVGGSIFSAAVAGLLLKTQSIGPLLATMAISWLTASYYKRRIGGMTGDCFGATIQLTEISVYLCGVWIL
jgi:adenosylcobinamide-GDP ribazoletransferase